MIYDSRLKLSAHKATPGHQESWIIDVTTAEATCTCVYHSYHTSAGTFIFSATVAAVNKCKCEPVKAPHESDVQTTHLITLTSSWKAWSTFMRILAEASIYVTFSCLASCWPSSWVTWGKEEEESKVRSGTCENLCHNPSKQTMCLWNTGIVFWQAEMTQFSNACETDFALCAFIFNGIPAYKQWIQTPALCCELKGSLD